MKREDLLRLFKFYREEKENPFNPKTLSSKWWEGEKALLESCKEDSSFFGRIEIELSNAIKEGTVSNYLIDDKISIEQRAIYFYLDLWNGKNHPYDSLDDIFEYVKA